ncbi:leishmanolysin family protein, putative [Ichthyophthirius multifiliis]|uniref:Leishmanolysin family protein, putative n=1 Tax=Ichthyophthirius multifiliis TaxID=5932 RepID=G0R6M4_ICHMU|nr:leishmanolysin family protein, putative [Ichthyophthirius multifiliis]EGR26888.1 leishmanolysin family protein, putative [Ichthyophthirius multifiliis]|eukprot:XP_004023772.1 leishmanolysin family protein, putative [Ichthyophthirius multifiliis]
MQKFIIILLLITFVFGLKVLEHECGHDKFKQSYKYESIPQNPVEESSDVRNLQYKYPRNMLITYNMDYFKPLAASHLKDKLISITNSCEKALNLAIQYFSRLIRILPKKESDMRYKYSNKKCGLVPIPDIDRTQAQNSDLHLYVSYTVEPGNNTLAHAGWCQFIDRLGPTHGTVNFNLGLLAAKNLEDPIEFEDLMEIVIHEITHILGFSDDDVKRWVNSNGLPYTNPITKQIIRGVEKQLLSTPHVLAFAKKYYGCENLKGMPLEDQGGSGSAGSHWEQTAIADEYMNASISKTQAYFSAFTTNLLRDTGFYVEVNASMEEATNYGQGEGCQFILGRCDQSIREFCRPVQDDGLCDYYHHGSSVCTIGQFNDPNCNTSSTYSNGKCWDTSSDLNTQQSQLAYGIKFGINSKCFNVTLLNKKFVPSNKLQGKCYQHYCQHNSQQLIIQVGNQKVICTKNQAQMQVDGYNGYIQCPENIQEFCNFKKFCPNYCSANGYCLKGQCNCDKGFYGSDCSLYSYQ